jgi:tetratricopeptide (TPR) repeat protein
MNNALKLVVALFVCVYSRPAFTQDDAHRKIDSLKRLANGAHDTVRVQQFNAISLEYLWNVGDKDSAMQFAMRAFLLAKKVNYPGGLAYSCVNKAVINTEHGEFDLAHKLYDNAEQIIAPYIEKNLWAKAVLVNIYYNKGRTYKSEMNYSKAVDYFLRAIRLAEPIADANKKRFIEHAIASGETIRDNILTMEFVTGYLKKHPEDIKAKSMIELGGAVLKDIRYTYKHLSEVFTAVGDYAKAKENLRKGLKIAEELEARGFYFELLDKLAEVQMKTNEFDSALVTYRNFRAIAKKDNEVQYLLVSNDGIARAYSAMGNFPRALELYDTIVQLTASMNDEYVMGMLSYQRADVFVKMNEPQKALEFYQDAWIKFSKFSGNEHNIYMAVWNMGKVQMKLANEKQGLKMMEEAMKYLEAYEAANPELPQFFRIISEAYEANGNIPSAFSYYKKFKMASDSIFNTQNAKAISDLQKRFEVEKKDSEIELLNKSNDQQQSEIEKQKLVRNIIIGGMGLVLVLVFFVIRSNVQRRKANRLLAEQKDLIEEKQKEILDSIYYARRIQRSLLGNEKSIGKILAKARKS